MERKHNFRWTNSIHIHFIHLFRHMYKKLYMKKEQPYNYSKYSPTFVYIIRLFSVIIGIPRNVQWTIHLVRLANQHSCERSGSQSALKVLHVVTLKKLKSAVYNCIGPVWGTSLFLTKV